MTPNQLQIVSYVTLSVLDGYSEGEFNGRPVYFKHKTLRDTARADIIYGEQYKKYKNKGVPTDEDALKLAIDIGVWSNEQENRIKFLESMIARNEETRAKMQDRNYIGNLTKTIEENKYELSTLNQARRSHMGKTAEAAARSKSNEFLIFHNSFFDRELTQSVMSWDGYDDMDNKEVDEFLTSYQKCFAPFSEENLKEAAFSIDFLDRASNSENLSALYGKPAVELTNYQIALFKLASYYSSILKNYENIPVDALQSAKDMDAWFFNMKEGNKKLEETKPNKTSSSDMFKVLRGGEKTQNGKDLLKLMASPKGGKKV